MMFHKIYNPDIFGLKKSTFYEKLLDVFLFVWNAAYYSLALHLGFLNFLLNTHLVTKFNFQLNFTPNNLPVFNTIYIRRKISKLQMQTRL